MSQGYKHDTAKCQDINMYYSTSNEYTFIDFWLKYMRRTMHSVSF